MNRIQRAILFITAFTLIVMLLFPPYKVQLPNDFVANQGYKFIFSPHINGVYKLAFDPVLLLVQSLIVISVGGILFLALKSK